MIYSRSAEYAIRSFAYLARVPNGKFAMAKSIAEQERIPAHFLSKILQDLTRKGLLRSSKGPSGGFALRAPASQIRLLDLVEALDGRALAGSLDESPWVLDSWRDIHSRIMDYLERHTIADVARALEQKKAVTGKSKRGRRAGPKKN
jgi:Rrf2 family protein